MKTRELSQLDGERDKTIVAQVERKEIHFTQFRRNTLEIVTTIKRERERGGEREGREGGERERGEREGERERGRERERERE